MSASALKPPTTIAQQLALLESKGLTITDRPSAEQKLAHANYFRLCCYKGPLWDLVANQFRPGTTFEDLWSIYSFDRHLRILLLEAIERCEISLRTRWAYELAHLHGPQAYENTHLFLDPVKHAETMTKVDEEIRRSKEDYIAPHQVVGAGRPPIWMAVEVISFGHLSSLFANLLNPSDRAAVSTIYDVDESNLKSFLHHLTIVRNLCAHHSRVWNRTIIVRFKIPQRRPGTLIPNFNTAGNQRAKIYNTLVMLSHLLDTAEPGNSWKNRVVGLLSTASISVTGHMGFPTDWQTRPLWNGAL